MCIRDSRRASRACQDPSLRQELAGCVSTAWTRSASTEPRAGNVVVRGRARPFEIPDQATG
eukprot:13814450-Alexandrium_andersonii.AAC.1